MTPVTLDVLAERLSGLDVGVRIVGDTRQGVVDVYHDHRQVAPGGMFCCVRGEHSDGHDHARAAVDAGAVALLCEQPLDLGVPELRVDDVRRAMGPVASRVHGDPSATMRCVGVTGTNGKTTTVALLAAILGAAERRCGVIGTLTGARTTPEATDLQRRLAQLRDQGCSEVAMEVSSHALVQHRVDGTMFAVAVFTNLSAEHLDYHGTMEAYFRAKARLFEPELSARGVVDTDDPHGRLLADAARIPVDAFSLADAEPIASVAPIEFTWRGAPVHLSLSGRFNVANALAAGAAAAALGVDDVAVRRGLEAARVVPGRFETIAVSHGVRVVVDFAHTPDGLSESMRAAREVAGAGRLLVVFGAGGDRDPSKRPSMGAAVARGADLAVITNDNPRHEDPGEIAAQIAAGMPEDADVVTRLDRRAAIAHALDLARPGDVVLVAGKGHETTQTIGDTVLPFDDRAVVRELLTERDD